MQAQYLSSFPVLQTETLLLRKLSINDANEVYILRSHEKNNEFLDRPKATSVEDAKAFIDKIEKFVANGESFFWAIDVNDQPTLAGTITLWNLDMQNNTADVGYELLPQYQGKGIMIEALNAVLEFAFTQLQLSKVEAYVHKDNIKSCKLLKRFNFQESNHQNSNIPAIEILHSLTAEDFLLKK